MTDQIDMKQKIDEQAWGDIVAHLTARIEALEAKNDAKFTGAGQTRLDSLKADDDAAKTSDL